MSSLSILSIIPYRFGVVFKVKGSTGDEYIVDYNFHKGWVCDCPDHTFRHRFCKHMQACHDFVEDACDLTLPVNVWCDNPKADMEFNDSLEVMV